MGISIWQEGSDQYKQENGHRFSSLPGYNMLYSLAPGRCGCDFKYIIFKHNLGINILSIQVDITVEWMPDDRIDFKTALVQVMAWCRQAPSHYRS